MSDIAIAAHNLSKLYRIGRIEERPDTLFGAVASWLRSPATNYRHLRSLSHFNDCESDDVLWALREVSFEIKQGEVVGVIGRNGAGKSTLLKILSRITDPTSGRAIVNGRVASLLEVGTGFHDDLTGRENVYLNGTLLGMTKAEVNRKFDEIVDFSGIEPFIDTPVKRYSSGMKVRLAFAVAAHLDPEVLLIDEVLAVGDAAFQRKCLGKMEEVSRGGRTVLFVSHQLGAVQELCNRCLVIEQGSLCYLGLTTVAISRYLQLTHSSSLRNIKFEEHPSKPISILEASIHCPDKPPTEPLDIHDQLVLVIHYKVHSELHGSNIAFVLSRNGVPIFTSFDIDDSSSNFRHRPIGGYTAEIQLPRNLLKAGVYTIDLDAGLINIGPVVSHPHALSFELEELSANVEHLSYAKKRKGFLVMPLKWHTRRIEHVTSAIDEGLII